MSVEKPERLLKPREFCGPKPVSPHPEVAVLPVRAWAEANPLEATLKEPKLTGMTL